MGSHDTANFDAKHQQFSQLPPEDSKCKIIQWWSVNSKNVPCLASVAQRVIVTQPRSREALNGS